MGTAQGVAVLFLFFRAQPCETQGMNPSDSSSPVSSQLKSSQETVPGATRRPRVALDHIGIAVASLPALRRLFEILGLGVDHEELVPEQGVRTHFVPLPVEAAAVEFLEPVDPAGTVAQFISKRGPGIHHLSFRVQKGGLEPLCAELQAAGYRLIYPTPRLGAHAMRIQFLHPSTAGGLLIELMEPTA